MSGPTPIFDEALEREKNCREQEPPSIESARMYCALMIRARGALRQIKDDMDLLKEDQITPQIERWYDLVMRGSEP